jgi:outer membrane immunogenic protein
MTARAAAVLRRRNSHRPSWIAETECKACVTPSKRYFSDISSKQKPYGFFRLFAARVASLGLGLGDLMKKLFLASVALAALLATPAVAADMPVKAPVPKAPPYDWSGFYFGAQGGGGWAMHTLTFVPGGDVDTLNSTSGAFAGGYAGYNLQVSPWFLLGVEAAWAWSNIKMTGTDCVGGVAVCTNEIKSLGSVRGRAGLVLERALVYVAGGWGFGDARYDRMFFPVAVPIIPGVSTSVSGPTGAGGVEIAFSDNFLGRFQYEYFEFKKDFAIGVLDPVVPTQMKSKVHTLGLGFAYKFGGPVAAKY